MRIQIEAARLHGPPSPSVHATAPKATSLATLKPSRQGLSVSGWDALGQDHDANRCSIKRIRRSANNAIYLATGLGGFNWDSIRRKLLRIKSLSEFLRFICQGSRAKPDTCQT